MVFDIMQRSICATFFSIICSVEASQRGVLIKRLSEKMQ